MAAKDIVNEMINQYGYVTHNFIDNVYCLLESEEYYDELEDLCSWLDTNTIFDYSYFCKDQDELCLVGIYSFKN